MSKTSFNGNDLPVTNTFAVVDTVSPFISGLKRCQEDVLARKAKDKEARDREAFAEKMRSPPPLEQVTLAKFLRSDHSLTSLMRDSFIKLKNFTRSDGGLLYLACEGKKYLYVCPTFVESEYLITTRKYDDETLVTYAAKTKNFIVTDDVASDSRFKYGLGRLDLCMKAAMGVPVLTGDGELVAVIELSRKPSSGAYNLKDKVAARTLATAMGVSIGMNKELCFWTTKEHFTKYFLHMIDYLSSDGYTTTSNENMLALCMGFIKRYVGAGQARYYLKADATYVYSEVLDETTGEVNFEKETKNISKTVADKVLKTGEPLVLTKKEAAKYTPLNITEFSVICYPIRKKGSPVKGAIELINKIDEDFFTEEDENIMKMAAKFVYVFIKQHANMALKDKLIGRIGVYNDLIQRQMKPCKESLEEFKSYSTPKEDFLSFSFVPKFNHDEYIAKSLKELFSLVLGDGRFTQSPNEFFLTVAYLHRKELKYSSFVQTFLVVHLLAYILLLHEKIFTDEEKEELMLSALLHNISVCPSNKEFTKSVQDVSYNSHICQILLQKYHCFSQKRFQSIQLLIKTFFMSQSFIFHKKLLKLLLTKKFKWMNPVHRFLVKILILKICEAAVWAKPAYYAGYRANLMFQQMNEYLAGVEVCGEKGVKKEISRAQFFKLCGKRLSHQHLPNIYILSMFLNNLKDLTGLFSENMRQWKLATISDVCPVWQQETSWYEDPSFTENRIYQEYFDLELL